MNTNATLMAPAGLAAEPVWWVDTRHAGALVKGPDPTAVKGPEACAFLALTA